MVQQQQGMSQGMCNPQCVFLPHGCLDGFQYGAASAIELIRNRLVGAIALVVFALVIIIPDLGKLGLLTSALIILIGAGLVVCGACSLIVVRQECCSGRGDVYQGESGNYQGDYADDRY